MNRFENDDAREEQGVEAAEGMILDLARLRPAAPRLALRERIAADLAAPLSRETTSSARLPTPTPRGLGWLAERMLWAAGGAIVAAVPLLLQPRPVPAGPLPAETNRPAVAVDQAEAAPPGAQAPDMPAAASTAPVIAAAAPQGVAAEPQDVAAQEPIAEESLAWSDDGVQFIDGQIPARVIRHWVLERFPGADGVGHVRPREDVFVVPVALR
ncbi:MAG: hypothetical protein NT171_05285 [Planctomycetota bacterium]|nr:hypothetical protein [Planctomycetota bacterium]